MKNNLNLDLPYLKHEGELSGVPVYSLKQDDMTDEEYAKELKKIGNDVWFINENEFELNKLCTKSK